MVNVTSDDLRAILDAFSFSLSPQLFTRSELHSLRSFFTF